MIYSCKIAFLITALFAFNFSFAQSSDEDYNLFDTTQVTTVKPISQNSKGTNIVSYIYGMGIGESHELRVDHFFHERWSLFYSTRYEGPASYLPNTSSETQFTAPIGLSVGTVMAFGLGASACGGFYNDGIFDLMIASAMIPDGVAYHHYLSDNLDFSPYVNISGLTFIQTENKSSIYYTPSGGARLMYSPADHFLVSAEYRVQYSTVTSLRSNVGLGVSIRF